MALIPADNSLRLGTAAHPRGVYSSTKTGFSCGTRVFKRAGKRLIICGSVRNEEKRTGGRQVYTGAARDMFVKLLDGGENWNFITL